MNEREFELYDCQDENFDDRYFDGEDLDAYLLEELYEVDENYDILEDEEYEEF